MRWAWIYNTNTTTSNNNISINMQALCCNHKQHVPWECPCDLVRWVAEFQFYGRGDLVATTPDQAHQDLSTTTTTTHTHRYAQLQTALVCRDSKQPHNTYDWWPSQTWLCPTHQIRPFDSIVPTYASTRMQREGNGDDTTSTQMTHKQCTINVRCISRSADVPSLKRRPPIASISSIKIIPKRFF